MAYAACNLEHEIMNEKLDIALKVGNLKTIIQLVKVVNLKSIAKL